MPILLRRILFVVLLLGIVYGIYWLVDKNAANDIKEEIIQNTQETIESFSKDNEESGTPMPTGNEIPLGDLSEIEALSHTNIIIENPQVVEPIQDDINPTPVSKKTTSTPPKKTNSSSSAKNLLFELFN